MKVNPDKFQNVVFGKCNLVDTFIIGDNVNIPQQNAKILRLHLNNKLFVTEHVSKLCSKANKQV